MTVSLYVICTALTDHSYIPNFCITQQIRKQESLSKALAKYFSLLSRKIVSVELLLGTKPNCISHLIKLSHNPFFNFHRLDSNLIPLQLFLSKVSSAKILNFSEKQIIHHEGFKFGLLLVLPVRKYLLWVSLKLLTLVKMLVFMLALFCM